MRMTLRKSPFMLIGWAFSHTHLSHANIFSLAKPLRAAHVPLCALSLSLAYTPSDRHNNRQVTRSSRYPLLIDPQGQALNWVRRHEKDRLPAAGVTSFSSERLRDTLEYCMMEGKALIITGVEESIDPMLTPVLEKQVWSNGKE